VTPHQAPPYPLQASLLSLLREEHPSADFPAEDIDACLKRYECGGYLYGLWSQGGRLGTLPPGWSGALTRAHRKTSLDTLLALADFRALGRLLHDEGVPFILLKGASYLIDLYDDPGQRMLTDIDLLIRPSDVVRLARRLAAAGYRGQVGVHYPEDQRFEMFIPGGEHCRFEFHWFLGQSFRSRVSQQSIWDRSIRCHLEQVPCRRPTPEDAVLYHVYHFADHYFGWSLKWAIDLREMLRRWRPDPGVLAERGAAWRVRVALSLALRHVEKLFPGEVPAGLLARVTPGEGRRRLLRPYLATGPVEMLAVSEGVGARYPLRCLLLDRPADAVGLTVRVLLRPVTARLGRLLGTSDPPWERLN
jgi:putative nucleotidyltransferase-like protein